MNNVSSKEKKRFLDEIIPIAVDPNQKAKYKKQLLDYIALCTNDGKLYKYRRFDSKGFALKNLREGTLHCARPDEFNDPFDCRLGITYTSVADAIIDHDSMDQMTSNVISYFHGKKAFDDCDENEQKVISSLQTDDLLKKMALGLNLKDTEKEQAFKAIIKEVELHTLKTKFGRVPEGLAEYIDNLDMRKIAEMENPPTLTDYIKSTGYKPTDKDEIGKMLDYAASVKCGDNAKTQEADAWFSTIESDLANHIANTFLIGCLAGNPKQRLMWSHYSNGHSGFCVEYDVRGLVDSECAIFPVVYSTKRPLIPFDAVRNPSAESRMTATINMISALLTKDECWSYENEWRVIIPASISPDIKIPITAVYLGANISHDNKSSIIEIAEKLRIPVKQMKTDRGEYELHAEDLLTFEGE